MTPEEQLSPDPSRPTQAFDLTEHAVEFLDNISETRMELLVGRALRRLGVDDVEETDGEEFADAFSEELKLMIVTDSMQRLQEAGLVRPAGVGEFGELVYELTPEGRLAAGQQEC